MRMRARSVVVVLAAAFAAACGDGDDHGPAVTPTPMPTPTATPTPMPTSTMPIEPCEGPELTLTIRSLSDGNLDVGWTGAGHDAPAMHDGTITADVTCVGEPCIVDGSDLVGRSVGAPFSLSAGGISVCVLASFREPLLGTWNCDNGCSELSAKLSISVFPSAEVGAACPACVGHDVDLGATSNDCRPAGSSISDFDVDLSPLFTGRVAVEPTVDCVSDAFGPARCFCPGQQQPNPCEPDGVCPASGVCEHGPIDSVCDGQPFRRCRSGTGMDDCESRFPGSGSCVEQPRPCFGSEIARAGVCGTDEVELVSIFCVPATGDAAIDTTVGLPGPAAITLPVALLRSVRQ